MNKYSSHDYGQDYLDWKNWGPEDFGRYIDEDREYFSALFKLPPLRRLKREARVLEIGFGTGKFLGFAQSQDFNLCATEVNPKLTEIAAKKGFEVVTTDNLDSFADNSFDLVVAFDVIEHIPQEKLMGLFNDIHRVLNNRGTFVARFPNGDSPFGLAYQNGDITHVTTLGSLKARYFAGHSGFEDIRLIGDIEPFDGTTPIAMARRFVRRKTKKIINRMISRAFYSNYDIHFMSLNLLLVCTASKSHGFLNDNADRCGDITTDPKP